MKESFRATLRVTEGGRVVIPAEARERLGLRTGSEVLLTVDGDQATLMSRQASIKRAQRMVSKYVPRGAKLSEELLAERRKEAARE